MPDPQPLHNVAPLHAEAEKASRLAALGLTEELLEEGMRYTWAEMDRCSGNDVAAAEGNTGYTKPMRFLRERLLPQGWTKGGPPLGLESVIDPTRSFQIVFVLGYLCHGHRRPDAFHQKPEGALDRRSNGRSRPACA
jgi:hypothetical protein